MKARARVRAGFVLFAGLVVCVPAFGDPNEPIYPPLPDVTVPGTVAVVGLVGIVGVALFRNLRDRIEKEPPTDEQISRRRRATLLSWFSVGLLVMVFVLTLMHFAMFLIIGLYGVGFVLGLIGFIGSMSHKGNAFLALVPLLLYVAVFSLALHLSGG